MRLIDRPGASILPTILGLCPLGQPGKGPFSRGLRHDAGSRDVIAVRRHDHLHS
jgi:hypothetical protein